MHQVKPELECTNEARQIAQWHKASQLSELKRDLEVQT